MIGLANAIAAAGASAKTQTASEAARVAALTPAQAAADKAAKDTKAAQQAADAAAWAQAHPVQTPSFLSSVGGALGSAGAALAPALVIAIQQTPLASAAPAVGALLAGKGLSGAATATLDANGLGSLSGAVSSALKGDVSGAVAGGLQGGLQAAIAANAIPGPLGEFAKNEGSALVSAAFLTATGQPAGVAVAPKPASTTPQAFPTGPVATIQKAISDATATPAAQIAAKPYGKVFPTRAQWEAFASRPETAGGTVGHPKQG